jgi:hypothetical protein
MITTDNHRLSQGQVFHSSSIACSMEALDQKAVKPLLNKKEGTLYTDSPGDIIDYTCDNRRFWLSVRNCQVPTLTSHNLELEQQIRIFGAD